MEDQEALIEESEKVIVSSPYHCFRDCYDVLGINEENGMVPLLEEEDDYWRYLGPLSMIDEKWRVLCLISCNIHVLGRKSMVISCHLQENMLMI